MRDAAKVGEQKLREYKQREKDEGWAKNIPQKGARAKN